MDFVEANGPFPGTVRERWLGPGYYYWDTFINSAHFWGRYSYKKYNKGYIIAKSEVALPPDKVLNLLDSADLLKFHLWREEFKRTFPDTSVTVEKVLTHSRKTAGKNFPYIAIKALFIDSINVEEYQDRISPNGKAYLDMQPPIQVCILEKSVVGPDNFKVIYPINYSDSAAYTF
ncbi:MAG: hypothetical protein K2M12_04790 [Muribaculaceae bacterium]|nr:hypothetical protein [Muribaculaceae bacterium]